MRRLHEFIFDDNPQLVRDAIELGAEKNIRTGDGLVYVYEDSANFEKIRDLVAPAAHRSGFFAVFDESDRSGAQYLIMYGDYTDGYPMPMKDLGFLDFTFDLEGCCPSCRSGRRQKQPFRLRKEPNWRRKDLFQLGWDFRSFFTRPEVYEEIFEPFGVGKREAIHHGKGHPLKTVVQLEIPDVSNVPLVLDGYETEGCERCSERWYCPIQEDFFPPFERPPDPDLKLFKTIEQFRVYSRPAPYVVVTQEVYQKIKSAKLRGLYFYPMAKGSQPGN